MLADYQLLAREQLICGTQVHVGVADRDESVVVANRVSAHVPTLLALSASSPFWSDGSDTGYSSVRTLVWQRWPTTGLAAPVSSAVEYDKLVAELVASGAITDAGMVYFDVRPAVAAPTLELRVCDSCPSLDTIVLIAGLFRALVEREVDGLRAGVPAIEVSPPLGRAALWRAARSGLEGKLVKIDGPVSRPAGDVVTELVRSLRPQLEAAGDWQMIVELTRQVLIAGTSAARQRRALRRRGRLTDVVDQLIAETAGRWPDTAAAVIEDPTLLFGYQPDREYDPADKAAAVSYDEAVDPTGRPRPRYEKILHAVADLGVAVLRSREGDIEQDQRAESIMFRVSGQNRAQVFPLDLIPRLIGADEWDELTVGLCQRAKALNAFLRDIYSEQAISFTQAALGADVQTDTIDGPESLRIPPGTQPSQVFRLRSKGVQFLQGPGRGDHYVHVSVRIPTTLDDGQRELLARYAEAEGETPLQDKGVFEKVKGFFTNP